MAEVLDISNIRVHDTPYILNLIIGCPMFKGDACNHFFVVAGVPI